jgi:hypothetical protein
MRWRRLRFPIWGLVALVAMSAIGFSGYRRLYLSHAVPLGRLHKVRPGMTEGHVARILGTAHEDHLGVDDPSVEWEYSRLLCQCRAMVEFEQPRSGGQRRVTGVHHYHK